MIWLWVWEISACLGGDLDAIVAWAKAHRVGLYVKTHDGATTNPNGDRAIQLIEKCKAAAVHVKAWGYNYPDVDPGLQASFAAAAGVDYVADVEVEWDGKPAQAQHFVDALLREMPERHISACPLPIVSYHDGGQYAQFNRLSEEIPQAYAGTGGRDAIGALEWSKQEWTVFPGCNIAPAVYAADQPAAELRKAIAFCFGPDRQWGNGDVSIWSLQHLTSEHIAVIDEFTQEADMTALELIAAIKADPKLTAALYEALGPTIQDKVVAPQVDTDKAEKAVEARLDATVQSIKDNIAKLETAEVAESLTDQHIAGVVLATMRGVFDGVSGDMPKPSFIAPPSS